MFRTVKPYLLLALVIGAWLLHAYDKNSAVNAEKERVELVMKQEYQKKLDKAAQEARETEKTLRADTTKRQEEKDEKIKDINRKLVVALDELRKRPSRPTDNSQNPPSPSSCTGAQLYREDGEFLTWEATRAERVLQERNFYYEQYESVRRRLDEASN